MTKIYKRPFKETITLKLVFEMFIVLLQMWFICKYFIFSGLLLVADMAGWIAFGVLLFLVLAVCCSFFVKYFFIVLHDNRIVVQNRLLPFLKLSRNYAEIGKVRFWMPPPGRFPTDSIEIVWTGKKRGGLFFGISMVDPKDLPEIVSFLESKGIKVDTYKELSPKQYREVDRKIRKGEL